MYSNLELTHQVTEAKRRAELTDSSVIDKRSLQMSHRRLAELILPGMVILDVGCGTGAITSGIAEMVGPKGLVIGVDNNEELIRKAKEQYSHFPNLQFEVCDIYDLPFTDQFDIVTSARVLQWLSSPQSALKHMKRSVKPGGTLLALDYNHEQLVWEPKAPASMIHFYSKFLKWRSDAGMDNTIADQLPSMFETLGLKHIHVTAQDEVVVRNQPEFISQALIWATVAACKGEQMVHDGYISEQERAKAESDYKEWVHRDGELQQMVLRSVEGTK